MKKKELVSYYVGLLKSQQETYLRREEELKQFQSAREAQLELQLADRQRECDRLTEYAQAFNMEHVVGRIVTAIKQAIPPEPKKPETAEQTELARMRRDNMEACIQRELDAARVRMFEDNGFCHNCGYFGSECEC